MKTTAIVDLRKGKVYRVPCDTLRQARNIARSRYYRPSRVVVKNERTLECYEDGVLLAVEHPCRLHAQVLAAQ
jgi:hypothetical protein